MQLALEEITRREGAETWLYDTSLSLQPAALTVLLGATRAGKTSLMRIMAGLDAPTTGRVMADGRDVTGVPVRKRNVAMVYQQFINYPSMTVAQNIASPLRLRGERNVGERVRQLAQRLHIDMFLDRLPEELSGGQQQRVALARALAKNAPLMLLDEPLVNLDYKLREELREELGQVFGSGESTIVYATTEPAEALMLGGHTAVVDRGRVLQYGPAAEVFQAPRNLDVARAYSDPPMNFFQAFRVPGGLQLPHSVLLPLELDQGATRADAHATTGSVTVGLRAASLRLAGRDGDLTVSGRVSLAEMSGSDTFLHLATELGDLVAQLQGVHEVALGTQLPVHFSPASCYVFDAGGDLALAPRGGRPA